MSKGHTHHELANYLVAQGFSGEVAINSGIKNRRAIRLLLRGQPFYTFGIGVVHEAIKTHRVSATSVQEVMMATSGADLSNFRRRGFGYFDPELSAGALLIALAELKIAAQSGKRIIFATGHPGALTGFLTELADWAKDLGAELITIDQALPVDGRYYLDMIGPVFVPSDNCSAWHSHDTSYLDTLLATTSADLVVGDHGFAGSALNHGIRVLGIYDTDDPALPLAASLGAPVLAIPLNDNRYNANGTALAQFLLKEV